MPSQPRARTKIVATVGPACQLPQQLSELVEAGVDVFRLNMAFGTREQHEETVGHIRDISTRLGPVAVLVDLAGPKIRLGELQGGRMLCHAEAIVKLVRGEAAGAPDELVTDYAALIDDLVRGDRVALADGCVMLVVEETSADELTCRVTQAGQVRNGQGVNLPGARLKLPAMTDQDHQNAQWAAEIGVDFVGLSFVRSDEDVRQLKACLETHGSDAHVIAKIERHEALLQLDEIVEAADGLMVARGDLGVETDVAEVAVVQKRIVELCSRHAKPVIVATQMLDSMQQSLRPTRAEVADVSNAILDGADACMLSAETAVGQHPAAAVQMMNRIALATEPLYRDRPPRKHSQQAASAVRAVTQSVVGGAVQIATELDAKLIVVATRSGATALAVGKRRGFTPVVGVSDSEATLRRLSLYWGVTPLWGAPIEQRAELLRFVDRWGCRDGILAGGDRVVVIAGTGLVDEAHNVIYVHEVVSGRD
ncbi:MAG: pyruvate kinase [Planctomycetes bacterium]|nr:pyruvate kinase [Planctomycetota bacterium]